MERRVHGTGEVDETGAPSKSMTPHKSASATPKSKVKSAKKDSSTKKQRTPKVDAEEAVTSVADNDVELEVPTCDACKTIAAGKKARKAHSRTGSCVLNPENKREEENTLSTSSTKKAAAGAKAGMKREVVQKEDLQSIEFATSRGKRKVEKAVTSETSQKSGPKKKAKKVIEDVIDEEEALVLICDGCENEFFYDDLYPKGDYE